MGLGGAQCSAERTEWVEGFPDGALTPKPRGQQLRGSLRANLGRWFPDGTGLVTLPLPSSPDFFLLQSLFSSCFLSAKLTKQLTTE